jgi:hypothetical protein
VAEKERYTYVSDIIGANSIDTSAVSKKQWKWKVNIIQYLVRSLTYYNSEVVQNRKTQQINSSVWYFFGPFFFTHYFEIRPYLIEGAIFSIAVTLLTYPLIVFRWNWYFCQFLGYKVIEYVRILYIVTIAMVLTFKTIRNWTISIETFKADFHWRWARMRRNVLVRSD